MTDIDRFITTWKQSGGAELANSQSFLKELCDVLGAPLGPDEAAKRFTRARVADVETMLHQLEGLGIVRELETGKFTA